MTHWNWSLIAVCAFVALALFALIGSAFDDDAERRKEEENLSQSDKEQLQKLREQQKRDLELFRVDDIGRLRRAQALERMSKEMKANTEALPPEKQKEAQDALNRAGEVLLKKIFKGSQGDIDYILKGPPKPKEQPRPASVDPSKNSPSSSSQERRSGMYVGDDDE